MIKIKPTKQELDDVVDSLIGYHERICGNGYDENLIRQAYKMGFKAALKQKAIQQSSRHHKPA